MTLTLDHEETEQYFQLQEDTSELLQKYNELVHINMQLIERLRQYTSEDIIDVEQDHN